MHRDDHVADSLVGEALGSLVPFGTTIGERMAGAVRREWGRLASKALSAAESESGRTREDLHEWIENEPHAMPLYMKVLWAAGMNGYDPTLKAMGTVLGQAARATADQDAEAFAHAELALQAMSGLTPQHFKVLATLADSVVIPAEGDGTNLSQFTPSYVSTASGLSEALAAQCLLNLANCGLTELTSVFGGNAFPMTDLGRAVLRASEKVI